MGKKTRLWYVSLLLEPTERHDWYNWRVVVEVADRIRGA